jgi:N-acylneuraminate cytidylyltransferase
MNICLIPARSDSKSIPHKNIIEVCGKPLIWWALNAANNSNLDKIYVSTDSDKIRDVVESFNFDKVVVIGRTPEVSTDTATTESVMVEFFNHLTQKDIKITTLTLIQPTSPLIKSEHINEGLEKMSTYMWDSVVSLVRQYSFQWSNVFNDNVSPQYDLSNRPRRQDYGGRLIENGAFYITTANAFTNTKLRVSGNMTFVEMPSYTLYEVDEESDLIIIEKLLEKYG